MHLNARILLIFALGAAIALAQEESRPSTIGVLRPLLMRYDRNEPPPNGPTEVKVGIYVKSFIDVSEKLNSYSMSFYLRYSWTDERLKFDGEDRKINVPDSVHSEMWMPDIFFSNERAASYHQITQPNRLITLNNKGQLFSATKISATLSCPMKLNKFPMDTQKCTVKMESFKYTMDTLTLNWMDVGAPADLPRFTLKDKMLYNCSKTYKTGSYPCLEIGFILERNYGFYIMQHFIPTMFMVILSWAAFWFDATAYTPRISIGLLCIHSVFLLSAWARSQLPEVSYITALDVWMSVCFIFVVAAFVEFVAVNFLHRRSANEGEEKENAKTSKIDIVSRIAFPVTFLVFNIIYWPLYCA